MATEYISREAAMQVLCDACGNAACPKGLIPKCSYGERMGSIPAADVRPVKHGEWIVDDHGDYQLIECDQCHAQMWNHQSELPNYCYECGADMRKVVEIDQVKEGAE